jgi:hypothetical protein
MGSDKGSIRAGYRVLLIATAIQGLTPDYGNLASSCLLRLVTSGSADSRAADRVPPPRSTPVPGGDHDGVPGEVCSTIAPHAALRARLDTGGRPCVRFLPVGFLDRLSRPAPRSLDPPGVVIRGPDGLIPVLCRFLC